MFGKQLLVSPLNYGCFCFHFDLFLPKEKRIAYQFWHNKHNSIKIKSLQKKTYKQKNKPYQNDRVFKIKAYHFDRPMGDFGILK